MVRSTRTGVAQTLARERLGVPAVLYFVLAAAAPLTVVAGIITTAYAVTGNLGLPVAFVAVGAVLAVFSVGYVAMSRHLPCTGGFYAFVSHGLGRPLGVAAAWVSLLAYNMVQVSLYGAIGAAVSPLVNEGAGVDLPWWVFAVLAWALVAVLGMARVDLNGTVLAVLLMAEIALILVYVTSFLKHPAGGYSLASWSPAELLRAGIGSACAIAVLGYIGFESAVVFAEESRNPRRTIPVATYLSLAVIAGLYGVSAWAMAVAAGPRGIGRAAQEQGPDVLFTLAAAHLGPMASTVGRVLFATSIVAAMISFHNTIARYVFSLGREQVLPPVLGRTSLSGAPRAGSLTQTAIGLTVIISFAVTGADPVVSLFYLSSTTGALGVLILLVLAGGAVLGYFAVDPRGEGVWRTRVAPVVSLTGLVVMLVLVLGNFAGLLGVTESSPLRWGLPVVFLAIGLAGAGYGARLRARRPQVYQAIGHGARACLTTVSPEFPQTAFATHLAAADTPRLSEGPQS